ncbi:rhodanese-like domain-containing protein [Chloroflexota bacterium]
MKKLTMLALSALLIVGVVLAGGCTSSTETDVPTQETPVQVFKDVTSQEAFTLIQENEDNPDFVILDVRTPREFDQGHIGNAINIDFYCETFREELDRLDKNKAYLLHCRSGNRSAQALAIMKGLGFREVYHMSDGIIGWAADGLPITGETQTQTTGSITSEEAKALIEKSPCVVIIDVRSPETFQRDHMEGAINIDYHSENFRGEIEKLDIERTYIVYCGCPGGGTAALTVKLMKELNFREAYHLLKEK